MHGDREANSLKIGINGRFLVAKKTGVQRTAYNLVKTLVSVDRENEYYLFTGKKELGKPEWDYPNVTVVASFVEPGKTLRNMFWEQLVLPYLAKKYKVDLLHSPANMSPLFFKGKSLVHIHDVCFVVNPQWYSFAFRTWYNWVIPRLAKRAARVITNSNNSKNDLLQFCKLPVEKVSMVYWAVDDSFLGNNTRSVGEEWTLKDYILYVGSLEPRKNIGSLVEAFQLLRNQHPDLKTKLILIGGESPLFAELKLKISDYQDDIILKGFVDDDELKAYYRHAGLVAYPSLYEGFGLPPLEAMASGAPVVTSITSSLPEVVGNAAIKVNPYDIRQLSESMAKILLNPDHRKDLINRGFEQVKSFNWFRVARNILAIYYEVYQRAFSKKDGAVGEQVYIPYEFWKKLVQMEEEKIKSIQF